MAKQVKIQQAEPPEPQKSTTIYGYRIERLSQYEYQAHQIQKQPDGTYHEKTWGKPDLLELVSRRLIEAARQEANDVYQKNKQGKQ